MGREKLCLSLIYCNRENKTVNYSQSSRQKIVRVDGHLPGFKVFQDSLPPFSASQTSLQWNPITVDWRCGTVGWAGLDPSNQPTFHSPLVTMTTTVGIFLYGNTWRGNPRREKRLSDLFYSNVVLYNPAEVPSWCDVMAMASSHASDSFCCSSQKQKELKRHGSYERHARINNNGFPWKGSGATGIYEKKQRQRVLETVWWERQMSFSVRLNLHFGSVYLNCPGEAEFMATLPLIQHKSAAELPKY